MQNSSIKIEQITTKIQNDAEWEPIYFSKTRLYSEGNDTLLQSNWENNMEEIVGSSPSRWINLFNELCSFSSKSLKFIF